MIGRHVLAAIDQGVVAADDDVARAALCRIDWVLRGRARRRLNDQLIEAALATGVVDDDPEARRHVLRAAALQIAKVEVDLRDPDVVARAYARRAKPTLPRWPVASIVAACGVLALSTVVAAATVMVATAAQPHEFVRPTPPPPAGAYAIGGSPVHDPDIESALRELAGEVGEHAPTREPGAFAPYRGVAAAWHELVDAIDHLGAIDRSSEFAELRARIAVVSDQLAAANLGYFTAFERSARNMPTIALYRVERIAFVRAGSQLVRVLDARRVAPEEPPHAVLGVKPEGMSDPVVVLEQIERHVDREYLPILEGRSYRLADDGWNRTSRGRQATAAVTFAIRRELRVALGREIVTHDRARDRLRELVRASVRHHEAQHVLEQDRPPVYPAALARLAGPLQVNGHPVASAIRARNELSAYTSQIASDMWLPQAALWNLARHAFERSRRGTPESYAAVIVLEGLSRQLGVPPPHGPTIHHGEIDRDRLAELVTPLAARSTIELRSAAARLWAELFGEPLVRLVDDRVGE